MRRFLLERLPSPQLGCCLGMLPGQNSPIGCLTNFPHLSLSQKFCGAFQVAQWERRVKNPSHFGRPPPNAQVCDSMHKCAVPCGTVGACHWSTTGTHPSSCSSNKSGPLQPSECTSSALRDSHVQHGSSSCLQVSSDPEWLLLSELSSLCHL